MEESRNASREGRAGAVAGQPGAGASANGGTGDRRSFLSAALDGPRARLLIGFAAFSAWVNLLVCFEGFLRDTVIYGGGVVHDPLFATALATGGVLLLVASATRPRGADGSAADAVAGIMGAVAGLAGVALSTFATAPGAAVTAGAIAAGGLAGLFIARYGLAWGRIITAFDIREMIVVLCAALCLQWAPFIAVTFLGAAGKAMLAGVLPLLSWWCLKGCRAEETPPAPFAAPDDGTGERESRVLLARTGAALFCFAFVVQLVWTCNVVMTVEPLGPDRFWLVYLCVLGVSAAVMFAILQLMNRWGAYRMELFYRAAFAFGMAGSAALPLAYNHLFFSYAVIYVAYALITATLWLIAWSVVFMRRLPARRVVRTLFGLQCLALPCGFVAAKAIQGVAAGLGGTSLLPYVCLIAVVVLVVAYAFVLPERTLLLLSPRLLKLSHESLDERCREVAAGYGLTERETEIFGLLARGRDVGYIEKELFISRNTVNTHRKNLYRKLGIHTQQELLSLIEDSLS